MKLERLPEYITIIVTIVCGMLLALLVGVSAGSDSNTPLMLIGGILAIMVALILRANIWILIPLCAPLTGSIAGTPGGFGVCHLAIFYAFVVFLSLKALKVVRAKPSYNWLDYLLWINLAYLLTAYIRNPVGTLAMGFEKIGGKPYVEVIIALLAYWVLNRVTISSKLAIRLPFFMIVGHFITTFGALVGKCVPSIAPLLGRIYTGWLNGSGLETDTAAPAAGSGIDREGYWVGTGTGIIGVLCSYFRPLSILNPLHIVRFLLTIIACVGILKSGFRSVFIGAGLFFLLANYFRSGAASVLRAAVMCLPLVLLLVVGQGIAFELPLNIQRTLSFLPGQWDPIAKENAQVSTEWRHEIWSNVWNSGDKYIQNWWLGDGFGMTRSQLREAIQVGADDQENLTVAGDYHSLPLSAVHVVGYVGFTLLLLQMGATAFYAWKLIERSRGTPYFPLSLFVGIPMIYGCFTSLFVFGAYNLAAPGIVYGVAWLRLINRSLDTYLDKMKKKPEAPDTPFSELELARFPHSFAS